LETVLVTDFLCFKEFNQVLETWTDLSSNQGILTRL